MRVLLPFFAALALLVACTASKSAQDTPALPEASACAAKGGVIQPICRMGTPTCVIRYKDAGKTCRNRSDCLGPCLLDGDAPADPNAPVTGKCAINSDPCGCHSFVDKGKVEHTICVD